MAARAGFMEAKIKTFTTKFRVYWADCDAAGIVYYGNFFRFFEIGEEEFFLSLGHSRPELYYRLQVGFPRAETMCRYYKPARMGDVIEMKVWIGRRTRRTLKFYFELVRQDDRVLIAEGNYTIVCVNRQFQPVPLPEELLQLMADYLPPMTERPVDETVKANP